MFRFSYLCAPLVALLAVAATAYTPPSPKNVKTATPVMPASAAATMAATAALSVLLATSEPAFASTSKLAAQITLNAIPPTSVQVNVQDLPLVGELLSGTYTKVSEPVANPSVTIASPKDKIAAIKAAATTGHLEFDINGLLGTHLDVDLSAEEAGVARVRVASPLIPQLPFKNNPASGTPLLKGSGKASEWFVVTNLGSGEAYYYNDKTGDTQFQKPAGF